MKRRKLSPQQKAKKKAHNQRTDRAWKIWAKRHVVDNKSTYPSGSPIGKGSVAQERRTEPKDEDWTPTIYGGVKRGKKSQHQGPIDQG
jgi:hypothetical protein